MGLARKRLANRPRLGADAEDVALSAFDSFFRGAEAGKFPKLQDRDDLTEREVVVQLLCGMALAKWHSLWKF